MKKRCYIAFLMLVLTVPTVLTGCKGAEKEIVSDELADEDEEAEESDPEEDRRKEKETEDTQEDGEEEKTAKEEAGEEVTPIKADRREIRDNMFMNETFGISFPITEDMDLLDDSEVLESIGIDAGFLKEGELASAQEMEDALDGILYDAVFSLDKASNSNITVSYENLDVTMDGNYPSEREFVKILKEDLDKKHPGIYRIEAQKTVTKGDVQYLRVDLEMKESELKEIFCCRRVENYMVCITMTFEEEKSRMAEDFIAALVNDGDAGNGDTSYAGSIEGTVEDGYYTNENFGIRFPITDNMRVMSKREMDTVQGVGNDYIEEEGLVSEEQMEQASSGTLYDLAIYLEDGVSNISVCYEDLNVTNNGIVDVDEEMYGKILRFTLSRLDAFNYEFREDSRVTLGGREYYRMDFDVSAMGNEAYQIYIFRKEGDYMISFIITYQDGMEQQVDDFLDSVTDL